MPLYAVETEGKDGQRLVEAVSASQAIRHCAASMFTARTIKKPADVAALMAKGVKLEQAGEEPPENEQE